MNEVSSVGIELGSFGLPQALLENRAIIEKELRASLRGVIPSFFQLFVEWKYRCDGPCKMCSLCSRTLVGNGNSTSYTQSELQPHFLRLIE